MTIAQPVSQSLTLCPTQQPPVFLLEKEGKEKKGKERGTGRKKHLHTLSRPRHPCPFSQLYCPHTHTFWTWSSPKCLCWPVQVHLHVPMHPPQPVPLLQCTPLGYTSHIHFLTHAAFLWAVPDMHSTTYTPMQPQCILLDPQHSLCTLHYPGNTFFTYPLPPQCFSCALLNPHSLTCTAIETLPNLSYPLMYTPWLMQKR